MADIKDEEAVVVGVLGLYADREAASGGVGVAFGADRGIDFEDRGILGCKSQVLFIYVSDTGEGYKMRSEVKYAYVPAVFQFGDVTHRDTYKLLGSDLWDIVNKAPGRVVALKVVEIVKEAFTLDYLSCAQTAFISMVPFSIKCIVAVGGPDGYEQPILRALACSRAENIDQPIEKIRKKTHMYL